MFTPFQRATLAVLAVGLFAISAGVWAKGGSAAAVPPTTSVTSSRAQINSAAAPAPGIVTIGEATVDGAQDSGYLAFAVQFSGPVGTDLAGGLQERVGRLLAKAQQLGVEDKDIILGPVQFQPQYAYDPQKGQHVTAFNGYQQIAIECDDLSGMPLLIQTLMKDEATSALSVRYAPSEKGPAYLVARQRAIEDARTIAETAATAAGVKLGEALSVSDYQPSTPQPYGVSTGNFPVVGGPGFPPAQIDTVIRVQVQFAIAEPD
jgi:uncharacterized protein YggE